MKYKVSIKTIKEHVERKEESVINIGAINDLPREIILVRGVMTSHMRVVYMDRPSLIS
tara:strand:+ start:272 stop:445 length:174 start_codon:yes stop_codon:yes gene_type:complete